MPGEVVNCGIKCRSASVMLRRTIQGDLRPDLQAERMENALFKLRSAIVSQETNCCDAQQVVD